MKALVFQGSGQTGGDVRTVRPGDRVLVSCTSAWGRCRFCRAGRYGRCRAGGGRGLGHTIDGTSRAGATGALKVARGGVAPHDAVTVPATRP